MTTCLNPHLGIYSKVSRAYASPYLLIIFLLIASLLMMLQTLESKTLETRYRLDFACQGLQLSANAIASTPFYTVKTTNTAIQSAIDSISTHSRQILILFVQVLKHLAIFLVDRFKKLLTCIIDAILAGAVNTVTLFASQISDFLDRQLSDISRELNAGLDGIHRQLSSVQQAGNSAIQSIGSIFGGTRNAPAPLTLPQVNAKLNFKLPRDFEANLARLSVPDLEDAKKLVGGLVSKPFDELITKLNSRFERAVLHLDSLELPLPSKASEISFCDKIRFTWIDELIQGLKSRFWTVIAILIVLGIAIVVAQGYCIYLKHSYTQRLMDLIPKRDSLHLDSFDLEKKLEEFQDKNSFDYVDWGHGLLNPLYVKFVKPLSARLFSTESDPKIRFLWFLNYILHTPFFVFIGMGSLGILLIQIQLLLLKHLKSSVLQSVSKDLEMSLTTINKAIRDSTSAIMGPYISQVNQRVGEIETLIHRNLFGWMEDSLLAVSQSGRDMIHGFNETLSHVFEAAPPLKVAVLKFVECMIGSALDSLESISSQISNSTVISLPRAQLDLGSISDDVLSNVPLLAQRLAVSLSTNSSDLSPNATGNVVFEKEMDHLLQFYSTLLYSQQTIFVVILIFGLLGFLIALGVIVWDVIRCKVSSRKNV